MLIHAGFRIGEFLIGAKLILGICPVFRTRYAKPGICLRSGFVYCLQELPLPLQPDHQSVIEPIARTAFVGKPTIDSKYHFIGLRSII